MKDGLSGHTLFLMHLFLTEKQYVMMRKIRINTGKVGLVFKNREYLKVLTRGSYWVGFGQEVLEYDTNSRFFPEAYTLDVYLQDSALASLLDVVTVSADEVVLRYEKNQLKEVLREGEYAYWKNLNQNEFKRFNITSTEPITELTRLELTKPVLA